jgi:hypothetical protein
LLKNQFGRSEFQIQKRNLARASAKSQKYLKNAAEPQYFDKFKGAFSRCTFNFSLNFLEKNIYKGFAEFLKFY